MGIETDTRDRVIALERDVKHLSNTIEDMGEKVTQMHELLTQAKGVRWMILAMVGLGGFIAGKLGGLWAYLGR